MKGDKFYVGAKVRFNTEASWAKITGKTATLTKHELGRYPDGTVWKVSADDGNDVINSNRWHEAYFDLIDETHPIDIDSLL